MKRIFTMLLLLTTVAVMAQDDTIEIIPGTGFGPFKLGMSEEKVKEIAGGTFTTTGYKEEMWVLRHFSKEMDIDSLAHFVLGFDKCLEAGRDIAEKWPVFKLYFQDDKLNFITMTSYSIDSAISLQASLAGKLKFFDTKEQSRKVLGEDYMSLPYPGYEVACYYMKGVMVMFEEEIARVIMIFPPAPNYPQLIKERSKQLKADYQASGDSGE